jgi:hypothetical protein
VKIKLSLLVFLFIIVAVVSNVVPIPSPINVGGNCDFIGGWGRGETSHCYCVGIKVLVDDSLPVDGNYETRCLGIKFFIKKNYLP